MLLQTPSGHVFMVHFHHQKVDSKLWDHETHATIHAGLCTAKARPCNTPDSITGIARSSRKDKFDKAEGRKLALARALQNYTRSLRRDLWVAYLKVHPPKPASFHKRWLSLV